jgi:hypothetical protein
VGSAASTGVDVASGGVADVSDDGVLVVEGVRVALMAAVGFGVESEEPPQPAPASIATAQTAAANR